MSDERQYESSSEAVINENLPAGAAEAYIEALLKENERVNLVSRETSRDDLKRLIAESLLPLRFLEAAPKRYLDIGSGGGFPAVPLIQAFAGRGKEMETFLMEPRQKKSAALRRICLSLNLRPEIIKEQFPQTTPPGEFDLITLRLVKLTPALLNAAQKSLSNGGHLVHYGLPDGGLAIPETACKSMAYRIDGTSAAKHISLISKY